MRLLLLCALFPSVMGFGTRPPLRLAPMQRREAWGVRREMGQRVAPQMNAVIVALYPVHRIIFSLACRSSFSKSDSSTPVHLQRRSPRKQEEHT